MTRRSGFRIRHAKRQPTPRRFLPRRQRDAGAQLAALIQSLAAGAINEARVLELIAEHAPRPRQHEIVFVDAAGERRNVGTQHRQFEQLLRACSARDHCGNRLNIWLAGPAGAGKTTAAENVAKALGLAFHFAFRLFGPVAAVDLGADVYPGGRIDRGLGAIRPGTKTAPGAALEDAARGGDQAPTD